MGRMYGELDPGLAENTRWFPTKLLTRSCFKKIFRKDSAWRSLLEGLIDDAWVELATGTTIGYKRLLRFGEVTPARIRVTITETRDDANILKVGAYYAPVLEENRRRETCRIFRRMRGRLPRSSRWRLTWVNLTRLKGLRTDRMIQGSRFLITASGWAKMGRLTEVSQGEFSNIKNNPIPQRVTLESPINARFIRLRRWA